MKAFGSALSWLGNDKKSGVSRASFETDTSNSTFASTHSDVSIIPEGFPGNLSSVQAEALQKLREAFSVELDHPRFQCAVVISEEKTKEKEGEPSKVLGLGNGDAFLLRFLRARNFDSAKATTMLREYLQWRKDFKVDEFCGKQFDFVGCIRNIYPHGYCGVDKLGRPIYIDCIGRADVSKLFKQANLDTLLAYWVQQYEYLVEIILPACSIAAGRRIEQGITILDLHGMGLGHFNTSTQTVLRKLAKVSQNYYPELLGKMYIVNAPPLFGPVWTFCKTLLDEKTVSKISLSTSRSSTWRQKLQDVIDPSQLPTFLGGDKPAEGNEWCMQTSGPWTDPKIVEEVLESRLHIPQSLLYLGRPFTSLSSTEAPTPSDSDGTSVEAMGGARGE